MRAVCRALPLVFVAGTAVAQQPLSPATARGCVVEIDSLLRSNFVKVPSGPYHVYGGGSVLAHCRDQQTTMRSDSMIWFGDRGELRLIGQVRYRDTTATLDADRLTYWVRQERLYAEGRVYTRNLRSGTDLRGPNLEYLREAPSLRDTSELYATRRPTINFFSERDTAAGDSAEPFVIVAERVRLRGNDRMWAAGSVTIDRSDLSARGDSASLDLGQRAGALLGRPRVEGKGRYGYELTGRRIDFGLTEGRELRRVLASDSADARGSDWHLQADTLDLALDSGQVRRAQAWGRHARPHAVSGAHTIVADSLDIHMPEQVVRLVWAYGRAHATSRPDSTVLEDDWIDGDTLRADFAVPDSSARGSELEHLTAFGSARALYHSASEQRPADPPAISYSRGRRIDIAMRASKVSTVDVVGQVDGIYLEPRPPRAAPADSTAATPPRPPVRTP